MKEFENYYKKHLRYSTATLDKYNTNSRVRNYYNSSIIDNNQQVDVFTKLIDSRIVYLADGLDIDTANIIKAQLLYLNEKSNDDISLYMDTYGGEIYPSLSICDVIDFVNCDVSTVNMGICASMGAILLTYGTIGKRKTLKRAKTMIHQPLGGVYGQASEIEIEAKEIIRVRKELADIIADTSNKDVKDVLLDMDRDLWLNAKETKKYGIVDIII